MFYYCGYQSSERDARRRYNRVNNITWDPIGYEGDGNDCDGGDGGGD